MWFVCFAAISGSLLHTLFLSTLNACRHFKRSPSGLQPLVSRAATSCLSHPGSCSLHLVASCSQGARERELLVCVHSHTFFLHDTCTVDLHSPSPIPILLHPSGPALAWAAPGWSKSANLGASRRCRALHADVCQRATRNSGSLLA